MQVTAPLSAEALAKEPWGSEPWEIIKGEFIPLSPTGPEHGSLALELAFLHKMFFARRRDWVVVGDNVGFLVARDPDTLLSPDVAVYRKRPAARSAWVPHAPDVAVEILSPDQTVRELDAKRVLFIDGGTEQVWIVDPRAETITVHHSDGTRVLYHDEELKGTGALDGFAMHVGEYFAHSPYRDQHDIR